MSDVDRVILRLLDRLEECHCSSCGSGDCGCGCDEVVDNLLMILDEDFTPDLAHRLLRHAATCRTCSDRLANELRIRRAIRRSCCAESAPSTLRMKVTQVTIRRYLS